MWPVGGHPVASQIMRRAASARRVSENFIRLCLAHSCRFHGLQSRQPDRVDFGLRRLWCAILSILARIGAQCTVVILVARKTRIPAASTCRTMSAVPLPPSNATTKSGFPSSIMRLFRNGPALRP